MPRSLHRELAAITTLATPRERLRAYAALHTRLEAARDRATLLQQRYALTLMLHKVQTLAAEERGRH